MKKKSIPGPSSGQPLNHETYMREIEKVCHGTMAREQRLQQIYALVDDWKFEIESEHNKPYSEIKPSVLPPINRRALLNYLSNLKKSNMPGNRSKEMESLCSGARGVADAIMANVTAGELEREPSDQLIKN